MKTYALGKQHKLCSHKAIDSLFVDRDASAALAYPLRAVWCHQSPERGGLTQFLISVPKKRLKRAVDRVAVRRRVREAYRLSRRDFENGESAPLDIAFIYVADRVRDYAHVESAMKKLLAAIHTTASAETQPVAADDDDKN